MNSEAEKAGQKAKGNVNFKLTDEECQWIYNTTPDYPSKGIKQNKDIIEETANFLEEREKGKQLDLVKAERERIFSKTGDEWAFIVSNFDDCPLRKEIVRFFKEIEEHDEKGDGDKDEN